MSKAIEFFDAASALRDLADDATGSANAIVALFVLSGIASADVVCCSRIGRYSIGDNHHDAIELLRTAMGDAAPHLARLLSIKSKAEYVATSVSAADVRLAERAAGVLLEMGRGV